MYETKTQNILCFSVKCKKIAKTRYKTEWQRYVSLQTPSPHAWVKTSLEAVSFYDCVRFELNINRRQPGRDSGTAGLLPEFSRI